MRRFTPVVQYSCDGDPVRAWRLLDYGDGGALGQIQHVVSGLCLTPLDNGTGLNVGVVLDYCVAAATWWKHVR